MNQARNLVLFSALAVLILVGLLWLTPERPKSALASEPLVVYCAAGIKPPVEEVVRQYEESYGVSVQLQFGGSGTLLSSLRVADRGDLYLAGDESYLLTARSNHLVDEIIPLAQMIPVIGVPRGNLNDIRALGDLTRVDVGLASPEAAAVGRIGRRALESAGLWGQLEDHARVFKPTVNDLANDLKLGAIDAAILWDSTVGQYPELEAVEVPELSAFVQNVSIGVLSASRQPTAALHLARYLGAPDRGQVAFARHHYREVPGDRWTEAPNVTLFSGAMLRPAIENTLRDFEQREGIQITTVYNGCGILTAQMRAGERPDAYFSCDVSFMTTVADLYVDPVVISDNEILMLVAKGNPKDIHSLADLTRPNLDVGVAHPEKSAMGALTKRLMQSLGLFEAIQDNVKLESPTGDFLVNQIRTGSLDVVVVCRSNAANVREHLDVVPIDHPLAKATQPYAVGQGTDFPNLMRRLQGAIESAQSRERFEEVGFRWQFTEGAESLP